MTTVSAIPSSSTLCGWLFSIPLENTINMDCLWSLVLSHQLEVVHEWLRDEHFDQCCPYHTSSTDYNALDVLVHLKRDQFESFTSEFDDEELTYKYADYDGNKEIVIEKFSKNVHLLSFEFTTV